MALFLALEAGDVGSPAHGLRTALCMRKDWNCICPSGIATGPSCLRRRASLSLIALHRAASAPTAFSSSVFLTSTIVTISFEMVFDSDS